VTTHVAATRSDEPGERTQIIPRQQHHGETQVMPAVRMPITTRATTMAQRHAGWLPRMWPLAVWFVAVLTFTLLLSVKSTGPLGAVVTIVWTYPVIGTIVGLVGALVTRRRLRRDRLTAADGTVIRSRDRLVVVVPTIGRHDTYPALDRVVHSYITYLPECFPKLRIDVVIEEGCEAAEKIHKLGEISRYIRVVTVPRSYHTVNLTKFKSRANNYAHELRIAQHEDREDVWVLHMDDDTGVGLDTAIALARLIEQQRGLGDQACHLAQGILTYPREHARSKLTWLADASRPIADVTVYSAFTGSGHPLGGVHGELLLVRASIEAEIGWDFGPEAIVEDAQFALIFSRRYPGRSAWFAGRCYGASPATVRDFFRQRERWAWGLIGLALDERIPLRDRLYIGYSTFTWVISPLQHLGTILLIGWMLGSFDTVPITLLVLPIWALNMAYAIWLYSEGLRINVSVSRRAKYRWWEGIAVILLVPIFSLMEGIGAVRGLIRYLRGGQPQFVVIAKPI